MANLWVYMNGYRVGTFTMTTSGAHQFQYDESWVTLPGSRPISLSMPLRQQCYRGDEPYNFFGNLLPDNLEVKNRVVARYQANSTQSFDLLSCIGQDCVGALQLVAQGAPTPDVKRIECKPLFDAELEHILTSYQQGIPLGMVREVEDFRISIAGAQEKTALLYRDNRWYLPSAATPTTHIIKLPIGKIESHSYSIDLSQSVENEYLCTLIAKEFGLPVPHCFIMQVGKIKALAVERFDRRYAADRSWIMRLPQEDFCQVLNVPSVRKYESHGGPSIADIMTTLLGSATPEQDRYLFMKSQVLFWLLAATDGHAKNFSVFIEPGGSFRLTPFYDILSMYPAFGGRGLHPRDAKLAMGLTASKGKIYAIDHIFPCHFYRTAKAVGFEQAKMKRIIAEFIGNLDMVISNVRAKLPDTFPPRITESILKGLTTRIQRLDLSSIE
ncbi:type II toxin-antitoxin system HipA family toxin [Aeromonas media]|uniref:type II toxin-antitoxin system HipA family toxin n=1 Tax=Aeromonas media TaxID=651 RepID=UPI0038D00685